MGVVAFSGRLLLSTIFIMSGVSKIASFDADTGGAMMPVVAPKLDCALSTFENVAALDLPLEIVKDNYGNLILLAGILEVAGGLLFILDFSFGAILLMLFLLGVTPVMHNFWDPACCKDEAVAEMNLSIFGGLLAYVTKVGKYEKTKLD